MNRPDNNTGKQENSEPAVLPIPREGRIGGIDFGTKRIGIAICDPGQSIASPLEIYHCQNKTGDAKYFIELAKRESLIGFVVGLPVHMSGDESEKSRQATEFGNWLFKQTNLPINWIDERYSTAIAREMLQYENLSGKKKKAKLDKIAAQVILMTFLERRKQGQGDSAQSAPELRLDD